MSRLTAIMLYCFLWIALTAPHFDFIMKSENDGGGNMKRIVVAGNSLVDLVKKIDTYPSKGMLAKIRSVKLGVGGCVPNTGITLKTLAANEADVLAVSRVGTDEYGKYIVRTLNERGVDTSGIVYDRENPTSFTDVMTLPNGERTFFCATAANDAFCIEDAEIENLNADIFHIGYLLLLKSLDEEDSEYGTKMARLLSAVQAKGIRTSIDVVSEEGNRFSKVVTPTLQYCDYAVVNEIEAARITGVELRGSDAPYTERFRAACESLMRLGVRRAAVIHCPEFGCACDERGNFAFVPSLRLPQGYIAGAVGAGDAFCAGMLFSFSQGCSLQEGLRLASCAAACNLNSADSIGGARGLDETLALEKKFGRIGIK